MVMIDFALKREEKNKYFCISFAGLAVTKKMPRTYVCSETGNNRKAGDLE